MKQRDPDFLDRILKALEAPASPTLPGSVPDAAGDDSQDTVFAALADAAPDVAPPPGLFERIEAQIDAPPIPGVETIAAESGTWIDRGGGIWLKPMAKAPDGKHIFLLRCAPGAVLFEHTHEGWEYAHVLEGQYQIAGRTVRTGDAQYSVPNSIHPEITTDTGCLLLVVG